MFNLEASLLEPPCCLPRLRLPAFKTFSQSYICAIYTLFHAASSQQPGCHLPAASAVLCTNPKSCCPRGDSGWLRCSSVHQNPVASLENARSWTLPYKLFLSQFFFLKESIIFKNRIWSCTRTRCMVFKGGVWWCQVEEHVSRRLGLATWKLFLFWLCNWACFRNFTWTESCRASLFILFFFILLR